MVHMKCLTMLFDASLKTTKMSNEWRSIMVPLYKNKSDMKNCNNYGGIKLLSHSKGLRESGRDRVRRGMSISENQF